jgi:hypothetical protein
MSITKILYGLRGEYVQTGTLPFLTPMLRPDTVHRFVSRRHNKATVTFQGDS